MMAPNRILLILLFVAIIAVFAFLILSPIISGVADQINKTPGAADLAVNYIGGEMTKAAYTPTIGTPPPSAAEIAATVVAQQMAAENARQAEQDARQAEQDAQRLELEQAQATQNAAWTATAWVVTQTAVVVQTQTAFPAAAMAYSQTQEAIPLIATTEAEKLLAVQAIYRAQADDATRKAAQEVWAAPLRLGVLVLTILGSLGLLWYYVRHAKRLRKLNDEGTVNLVEDENGVYHETNSDLMPTPSMKIAAAGVLPEGATDYQQTITTQAQKVKAIAAAALAQRPQETFQVAADMMAGQAVRYRLLEEPPDDLVTSDAIRVLDQEWESSNG